MSKAVFDRTTFDASVLDGVGTLLGHRVRGIPITVTLHSRSLTANLLVRDLITSLHGRNITVTMEVS